MSDRKLTPAEHAAYLTEMNNRSGRAIPRGRPLPTLTGLEAVNLTRQGDGPWRLALYRDATSDRYGVSHTDGRYIGIGDDGVAAIAVCAALNAVSRAVPRSALPKEETP